VAAHLRRNRASQFAVAMIVVMQVAAILFSSGVRREAEVTFDLENADVQAELTLVRVDPDSRKEIPWFTNKVFSRSVPLAKTLPPGRYLATVSARAHQPLERTQVEVTFDGPNQVHFRLERRTRGLTFLDLVPPLSEDQLTCRYQGQSLRPLALALPVGEKSNLVLEATGYAPRTLQVQVPDGDGPFEYVDRVELNRLVPRDRLISVSIHPEAASTSAQVLLDGTPQAAFSFRAGVGKHRLIARADGYREVHRDLELAPGEEPLAVDLSLSRPSRVVKVRCNPGVQVALRPHGRKELPQRLRDGDELEFEVGQRLVLRVEDAAVPVPPLERDVTVEPGAGPQTLDLAVGEQDRLRLSGLPYNLRRQRGGWFCRGFEPTLYQALLREKLPAAVGPRDQHQLQPADPSGRAEAFESPGTALARYNLSRNHADKIKGNLKSFEHLPKQSKVYLGVFYISEVPVTWGHWCGVMGEEDLAPEARADVGRFLRAHRDEPAVGISFVRWWEFCRRLTDQHRDRDLLGANWSFSPPTAAEYEYVLKGGPSDADEGAAAAPIHDSRLTSWLAVEHNLVASGSRQRSRTVWDPSLMTNRLGVRVGLVASWTMDEVDQDYRWIAGPGHHTHPNQPRYLPWPADLLSPTDFGLPNERRFLLHDTEGYWPWQKRTRPIHVPSEADVGLYLVLRPTSERSTLQAALKP
jgi:hypothetical protein